MTKNQIEYNKLLETRRSNLAQEAETKRTNIVHEKLQERQVQINDASQAETARHNLATEQEVARHNVVAEAHSAIDVDTRRMDAETRQSTLVETQRHNLVVEGQNQQSIDESIRHNLVLEDIGYKNASAALTQASAAMSNANTRRQEYAEAVRHNTNIEVLTREGQIRETQYKYDALDKGRGTSFGSAIISGTSNVVSSLIRIIK